MRALGRIVPAIALAGLAEACGTPAQVGSAAGGSGSGAVQAAAPSQQLLAFGAQYHFADGITISVATPKSFRPSASAYPPSDRGVAFDITIRNNSDQSYQLSGLSASATVAGASAKQLVDPTQGYTGIVDADNDVPEGRDVEVTLAFAVPGRPADLRLSLRPSASSTVVAIYTGTV